MCVLALEDDEGARKAVEGVRAEMVDPQARCLSVTLQVLADTVDAASGRGQTWADAFRTRYLDLTPID